MMSASPSDSPMELRSCLKGAAGPAVMKGRRGRVSFVGCNTVFLDVEEGERKYMVPYISEDMKLYVRQEVDWFKEHEMEVHPDSRHNTKIWRLKCYETFHANRSRKVVEANEALQAYEGTVANDNSEDEDAELDPYFHRREGATRRKRAALMSDDDEDSDDEDEDEDERRSKRRRGEEEDLHEDVEDEKMGEYVFAVDEFSSDDIDDDLGPSPDLDDLIIFHDEMDAEDEDDEDAQNDIADEEEEVKDEDEKVEEDTSVGGKYDDDDFDDLGPSPDLCDLVEL